MDSSRRDRSRNVATWLALAGGCFGLHRFYLFGKGDGWAWLHLPPTLVGAYGLWRMRATGTEDLLGSVLVLLLGATIAVAMLEAIAIALLPGERWNARFGSSGEPGGPGGPAVAGAILALAIGAIAAMATIAFAAQRYFEWRAQSGRAGAAAGVVSRYEKSQSPTA